MRLVIIIVSCLCVPELRKQEYEKKRKQYEAVRKKRKGQGPALGSEGVSVPQPKVKKRRTKSLAAPPDPNSLGVSDLSGESAFLRPK